MTKRTAAFVVVLLTALPGFGLSGPQGFSAQNQFHFTPARGRAVQGADLQSGAQVWQQRGANRPNASAVAAGKRLTQKNANPPAHALINPPVNPPVSKIGFVSATQVAAGGAIPFQNPALAGDFNGDGKKDVVTIVKNVGGGVTTYSLSVALGNGDGTFQAPVLTATPGNLNDPFVVGDVNGDGKDDIIIAHNPGATGPANFDVMLSNGDGTFTLKSNNAVTTNSLAGGMLHDVNGDGKLDVVIVDSALPGNVWTLLGNGDGTFQAPTSVALNGQAGSSLVFGDFNGDGLPDFADNDYTSGQLTVYLATSTGYAAGASYATPDGVYDACRYNTVGDLTGDGKPEIVTANCTLNTITIYVNKGDGTFATGVYSPVATAPASGSVTYVAPWAVEIADVNGDGRADIIATNYFSSDVTVLLGNGDGTVQVPSFGYATSGFPNTAAVVADLDGDGLADILVADSEYGFAYMKGYGDGTFRAALDYYSPTTDNSTPNAPFGWDIAAGDLNGDGFPDVVIGNWCCDATVGITVFLSAGDGTLQKGVNYGSGGNWAFVAVADFNKDGKLDIAALDNSTGTVQIYNGVGDGTFTAGPSITTGDTDSEYIVAGDLNGDGYPDLVVADRKGSNLGVILNDGTGGLKPLVPYALFSPPSSVTVADVNGDGKLDLIAPEGPCACVAVRLGNGDGTFQPELDTAVGNLPFQVAVGDLNGDGKMDFAVTIDDTVNGQGVQVALGNGDGTFQPASAVYPTSLQATFFYNPYPTYLRLVDLDGDGKLDAVYTNRNYGTVGVMYGVGNGTFYDPVEYPTAGFSVGLALADVNGDGAVDVVTTSNDVSEVAVLLNNSSSASALASSVNPAAVTQTITFTATVSAKVRGVATVPTGTVTFFDGSTSLGSASLSGGAATLSTSSLAIGSHSITAQYSGDASFHGSTSSALSQVVNIAADSTTLISSVNPSAVTQSVTFTATVASTVSGLTAAPTGTVTFFDGATSLGSGTMSGGVATLATSSLAIGTHSITAQYGGDANFSGSTSTALSQVVTPTPDYTLAANPTSATVTAGGTGSYVITLTPSNNYNGTVTFTCGTLPSKTTCSFSNPTLTPSGNGALTTTLSLKTTATMSAMMTPRDVNPHGGAANLLASFAGLGFFGLLLAGGWKKKSGRRMGIILGVVALGMVIALVACSGGGNPPPPPVPGTPTGTYPVTVTGTGTAGNNAGNTAAHTLTVTLIVQ